MTPGDPTAPQPPDEAAAEILEHSLRGESLDVESLLRRHSTLSSDERERLRAMAAVLRLGANASAGGIAAPGAVEDRCGHSPMRFGAYELLRELGRGGQAAVHLARDTRLGRLVALKVLEQSDPPFERLGSSSGPAARLKREAEVASKLDHPGICSVYEMGVEDGRPFIAMRYVEGETLARSIAAERETAAGARHRHSDWARAVEVVEHAARALHVAHEAGVVHRDIKPANLMVTPSGQPVILDFGMARDDASEGLGLTQTGDVVGSPAYMAPEQIEPRRGAVDARTDVYGLGAVLFEYLTMRRPFESPTRDGLYHAILSEPLDLCALGSRLPRDLAVVVGTALEKDPRRRYATARDFAEDLRRVRAREPILARPAGPFLRLRRWTQRNPGIAASIAGAFTVLVAVIAVMYLMLQRVRAEGLLADSAAELPRDPARALELALAADELGRGDPAVVGARMLEAWSRLREAQRVRVDTGEFAAAFSPATHVLVTCGEDAVVRLWDTRAFEDPRELGHHASRPSLALSSDGRWVATVSAADPLRVWDTATLEPREFGPAQIAGLAFAPDSRRFAVIAADAVAIHDLESPGAEIRLGEGELELAEAAIWSPDGRWVAVTDAAGCRVWSADGVGTSVRTGFRLIGGARAGFSPDSRLVVLPSDLGATVFDLNTGATLEELPGSAVRLAAFHPAAEKLVVCFQGGGVHLVDWRTGHLDATLETNVVVDDVAFSRDGSRLFARRSGACPAVYALRSGNRVELATDDPTSSVFWDEDEEQAPCITTHPGGVLRRWSLWTNLERAQLGSGGKAPEARGCATAGDVVAVGRREIVEVYSLSARRRIGELAGRSGEVRWVDVSADGGRIATAGSDGTARIWRVATLDEEAVLEHGDEVWAAEFSPDGRWLATGGNEGRIRIYAVDDPENHYELPTNRRGLRSLCFDPRGDRLISVSEVEGWVRLWDLRTRQEIGSCFIGANDGHGGNHAPINACFHPDGRRVAITSFDGVLYEWSALRDAPTVLARLPARISDADYSPDGSLLALACGDGRIHLLPSDGARELSTRSSGEAVRSVAFSSDGREILGQDASGVARLWPTDLRAAARGALAPLGLRAELGR